MSHPPPPIVQIEGLYKSYRRGDQVIPVLEDISLSVPQGQFLALMGPSGSGKTTLLNIVAGLDRADAGRLVVAGTEIGGLGEVDLATWRARHVGFIFQFYNLIPVLTAFENVELPLLLTPLSRQERRRHVALSLDLVGLEGRQHHTPSQLSGGQQQRVAIARALVTDPTLIAADEPTGDLDKASAEEVLELLARLNSDHGKTIIMVTHDPRAAARASRVINLDKGVLVD
ncbi:MAG: ABC transporter ATP-binding protein [Desulfarculus sp.]|nr:ABC transporter ATP-binding protein [Desulfarculus sp.]